MFVIMCSTGKGAIIADAKMYSDSFCLISGFLGMDNCRSFCIFALRGKTLLTIFGGVALWCVSSVSRKIR